MLIRREKYSKKLRNHILFIHKHLLRMRMDSFCMKVLCVPINLDADFNLDLNFNFLPGQNGLVKRGKIMQ